MEKLQAKIEEKQTLSQSAKKAKGLNLYSPIKTYSTPLKNKKTVKK